MKATLTAVALLVAVAACGGTGGSQNAGAASSPSPAAASQTITVTETEFAITPKTQDLKAGGYRFHVVNAGNFTHDFHLLDAGGTQVGASQSLKPGTSEDVQVALKTGSYSFFCAVDSHKDKGMSGSITVT